MKIIHILSVSILALAVGTNAIATTSKPKSKTVSKTNTVCKQFDITKGDLRFTERGFTEIVSITGGVTDNLTGSSDLFYTYRGGEKLPKNHPLMNTRRYEYFAPLAILFQPTGEAMQVAEVGKTFKPSSLVFTTNLNAIVLADQRRGKRVRLDPIFDETASGGMSAYDPFRLRSDLLGPNKKPNYKMYYPLFQSVGLGFGKNVNLEICLR